MEYHVTVDNTQVIYKVWHVSNQCAFVKIGSTVNLSRAQPRVRLEKGYTCMLRQTLWINIGTE
jgi:hypothetical protein